jgi:flavin-dependent dehydrogenase
MKIAIIGGGPGGLLRALMKKALTIRVTVLERNRRTTFRLRRVFSTRALDNLMTTTRSPTRHTREFSYRDDRFLSTARSSAPPATASAAPSAAIKLMVLQSRRELGVKP